MVANGSEVVVILSGAATVVPNKTARELGELSPDKRSARLSPLKSPATTATAAPALAMGHKTPGCKLPSPLPRKTSTALLSGLETAISSLPSALKSATATPRADEKPVEPLGAATETTSPAP